MYWNFFSVQNSTSHLYCYLVIGKKEAYPHVERGATALKMHINYDPNNTDYDVALIKLDEPIDLDLPNIGTICLPSKETELYVGREATVTGWGMMSYSGKTSNILRQVIFPFNYFLTYSF